MKSKDSFVFCNIDVDEIKALVEHIDYNKPAVPDDINSRILFFYVSYFYVVLENSRIEAFTVI